MPCPDNSRTQFTGSTSVDACTCLAGYIRTPRNTCESCPPGYYSPDGTASNCIACADNQITNTYGARSCAACPVNSKSSDDGTQCTCLPGYYGSLNGTIGECLPCPRGTYRDENSTTPETCTRCFPLSTTLAVGAKDKSECGALLRVAQAASTAENRFVLVWPKALTESSLSPLRFSLQPGLLPRQRNGLCRLPSRVDHHHLRRNFLRQLLVDVARRARPGADGVSAVPDQCLQRGGRPAVRLQGWVRRQIHGRERHVQRLPARVVPQRLGGAGRRLHAVPCQLHDYQQRRDVGQRMRCVKRRHRHAPENACLLVV